MMIDAVCMNDIDGSGWNWVDGASCAGGIACEDDPHWSNRTDRDDLALLGDCASIQANGNEFFPYQCNSIKLWLCNILPTVDYICVYTDIVEDNITSTVWSLVLEYDNFYRYINTTFTNEEWYVLEWINAESRWNWMVGEADNMMVKGYCYSSNFVLPSNCTEWHFLGNQSVLQFETCPCM